MEWEQEQGTTRGERGPLTKSRYIYVGGKKEWRGEVFINGNGSLSGPGLEGRCGKVPERVPQQYLQTRNGD